jgi:hypothetical protein
MKLDDALGTDGPAHGQAAVVDPLLDGHVRLGLDLKVPFIPILAVVVLERTFDVDRVGVVAFNQIRVVAAHGAHEACERYLHRARQAAAEPRRLLGELERQVVQIPAPAVARVVRNEKRLHRRDGFVSIIHVRSYVRCRVQQNCYITCI